MIIIAWEHNFAGEAIKLQLINLTYLEGESARQLQEVDLIHWPMKLIDQTFLAGGKKGTRDETNLTELNSVRYTSKYSNYILDLSFRMQ